MLFYYLIIKYYYYLCEVIYLIALKNYQVMQITVSIPTIGQVVLTGSNFETQNDSIGYYECHGSRGYDEQEDYTICYDVDWDTTLYTEKQNKKIQEWIDEQEGTENCPHEILADMYHNS